MRFSSLVASFVFASLAVVDARSARHVGRQDKKRNVRTTDYGHMHKRPAKRQISSQYLSNTTASFVVDGTAIPDMEFDLGESYAGSLPISKDANETSNLWFWFFPTENTAASDEILIWLNGGPGCSSLEGLLQENGPVHWQYGTLKPVLNPYSWTNLTNVVWVDQPVGTGFSTGNITATNEDDIARQFLGWFENFVDLFALQGRKVYITGESYAGYFISYIANSMLDAQDAGLSNYTLEGTMMYDPIITWSIIPDQVPAIPFLDRNPTLFPFNDTYSSYIRNKSQICGFDKYRETYLTYPPPSTPFPGENDLPGQIDGQWQDDCDGLASIIDAATLLNPCFNFYHVTDTCPLPYDVLGFPGSVEYLPAGGEIYFNRADVKNAINAPLDVNWEECTSQDVFVDGMDKSNPPTVTVLSSVIERSKRTVIGHGSLDMLIMQEGTLLAIQNLTWGGQQGFQSKPSSPFYVPYHENPSRDAMGGAGVLGTTHTERGLTWVGIELAGHMVPQYAPSASYRTLEFLLGRIDSLESTVPFTTSNTVQYSGPLGNSSTSVLGNGTSADE